MDTSVVDRTPLIEQVLDELTCLPLTESGRAVLPRFSSGAASAQGRVTLCAGLDETVAQMLRTALAKDPACGVLIVSARSRCDAHGVVRSMLSTRVLDSRRLALFGLHEWSVEERAFLDVHRIQIYSMLEISREGLHESTDAVMMFVRTWRSFMLLLDMDVLDPAFAPGIANTITAGMTARELLYVVQRLALIPSLAGALVVADGLPAVNIDRKAPAATTQLCARLVAELAAHNYVSTEHSRRSPIDL